MDIRDEAEIKIEELIAKSKAGKITIDEYNKAVSKIEKEVAAWESAQACGE